jgi:hypothetical protein
MQWETKEVFAGFDPNLRHLRSLTEPDLEVRRDNIVEIFKPIRCAMDCNVSAVWKILKMGGSYHNQLYGCHLCCERKDEIAKPNGMRCDVCFRIHLNNTRQKCYHRKIISEENIDYRMGLAMQKQNYPLLTFVQKKNE